LFYLQAQRFIFKEDALKTLAALSKRQKYHQLTKLDCIAHKVYEGKGCPKKDASVKQIVWQTSAKVEQKGEAIQHAIEQKSCFILATNADKKALTPEEVLHHYKAQSAVERGFRFLKDPWVYQLKFCKGVIMQRKTPHKARHKMPMLFIGNNDNSILCTPDGKL